MRFDHLTLFVVGTRLCAFSALDTLLADDTSAGLGLTPDRVHGARDITIGNGTLATRRHTHLTCQGVTVETDPGDRGTADAVMGKGTRQFTDSAPVTRGFIPLDDTRFGERRTQE